jgi:hypothetical protein
VQDDADDAYRLADEVIELIARISR